jgi:hypothetical protein
MDKSAFVIASLAGWLLGVTPKLMERFVTERRFPLRPYPGWCMQASPY